MKGNERCNEMERERQVKTTEETDGKRQRNVINRKKENAKD